jgi:hypothetical protein
LFESFSFALRFPSVGGVKIEKRENRVECALERARQAEICPRSWDSIYALMFARPILTKRSGIFARRRL